MITTIMVSIFFYLFKFCEILRDYCFHCFLFSALSAREFYLPEPKSEPEQHANGEPMDISPKHQNVRTASPSKIPRAVKASKIPRKMDSPTEKSSSGNHHNNKH